MEPSKITVYKCENVTCEMFERQWQSFVDDMNVHKLVEQYDTDGNVVRVNPDDNQSAPDLLVVEVPQPTDQERSVCPSCGVEGTKVPPNTVEAPPGVEVV